MADSQFRAAYLLEGGCSEWLGLGVSREAIQGALITLMLIFDIPVFRSSDTAESARMIFYIGSQLARLRDPEYLPYRQAKAKRKKGQQIRILRSFPGVGPDRAKALLDRFKTVRACLNASRNDLMDVKGVGPRTAAAIYNVVNR
jgi:ERCC4-type nuclease